jgi:hypothetical protein
MRAFLVLLTAGLLVATASVSSAQVKSTSKKSPGTVCYVCGTLGQCCVNNQCVPCGKLKASPGKGGPKKGMKN